MRRLVPDAHGAQSARDDAAMDPVPIADEVARSLIPRKCLRDLTCNPFDRRISGDADTAEVPAVEPDDDKGIEQVAAGSQQCFNNNSADFRSNNLAHHARSVRTLSFTIRKPLALQFEYDGHCQCGFLPADPVRTSPIRVVLWITNKG